MATPLDDTECSDSNEGLYSVSEGCMDELLSDVKRSQSCHGNRQFRENSGEVSRTKSCPTARDERWAGNPVPANRNPPTSKQDQDNGQRRNSSSYFLATSAESCVLSSPELEWNPVAVSLPRRNPPSDFRVFSTRNMERGLAEPDPVVVKHKLGTGDMSSSDYTISEEDREYDLTRVSGPRGSSVKKEPTMISIVIAFGFIVSFLVIVGLCCVVYSIEKQQLSANENLGLMMISAHEARRFSASVHQVANISLLGASPPHLIYTHLLVQTKQILQKHPNDNQIWSWLGGAPVDLQLKYATGSVRSVALCDPPMSAQCRLSFDVINATSVDVSIAPGDRQMALLGIISIGDPFVGMRSESEGELTTLQSTRSTTREGQRQPGFRRPD